MRTESKSKSLSTRSTLPETSIFRATVFRSESWSRAPIDQVSAHAVLAFFVKDGQPEYRLTYAARESSFDLETLEVQNRETAPKRFTFLLGPAEPCRTAALRLSELAARRDSLTFRDVERAFSVERLNKEFFGAYKKHYQRFVDYLINETDAPEKIFGVTVARDEEKEFDKACKPVRDFAKRLLGRAASSSGFSLQREGWLGCNAKSKDWVDGGLANFMLHYFPAREGARRGRSLPFPMAHTAFL